MLETGSVRKNKINLSDYNCEQDIYNRTLMSNFSTFDLQVLGEILFSPLKISLKKLSRSLGSSEEELLPVLHQLSKGGLLSIQDDNILVDKEIRKYFEFQITRFDPDFKPDMEFLQNLLRKVPIHCLPAWHAIPRSSNNIFESILEKYLLSPQIFQRYLNELHFTHPTVSSIVSDLFKSQDFKITSTEIISKYNLTRQAFEEALLLLEFSFVCCLTYEKQDEHWIEYVTPFYEWHQYLRFLKQTEAPSIAAQKTIRRKYKTDFAFIEEMSFFLEKAKKQPYPISALEKNLAIEKLCMIKLAERIEGRLHPLEGSNDWLNMNLESRSLFLYRHPLNRLLNDQIPSHVASERNVREAEKAIKRALHSGWIFFDDFLKGVLVSLSEESVVMLKKTGKQWRYTLPVYSDHEKALLKAVLLEWLFETGMTVPGECEGKDCFTVTAFGKFFFDE
jgi:hypothetical protein